MSVYPLTGHETTSQLLTWAMYLLARHPDWQERLRSEVAEVSGGLSEPTKYEHLASYKQMHMVLLESLRMFPPVPDILRELDEVSLASKLHCL